MASTSTTARESASTVDFNTAMNNFRTMFPELTAQQIESALRKNDGDVESTVDDLLRMSGGSSSSTSALAPSRPSPPSYKASSGYESQSMPSRVVAEQPNCDEDEKIALMLQNREFLRYLRANPAFMRELNYDTNGYNGASSSSYSPRRHEPVLTRCKRLGSANSGWTVHQPPSSSQVPPEDYYDTYKTPIPDGPLVDPCERPLTRLSKKIKSKLPSTSGAIPRPEDMYPHTVTVDYAANDESFTHRLKNMSKNTQSMFLGLAKRFNMSKRNGSGYGIAPDTYSDQTNEFSYDLHQNSVDGSNGRHQDSSKFL